MNNDSDGDDDDDAAADDADDGNTDNDLDDVLIKPLKSTNLTELCQISLGRRWIRKSNKLTKSKVNPNGTPMYDKLCFGKFCCVKDEETPCGRNSQNICRDTVTLW